MSVAMSGQKTLAIDSEPQRSAGPSSRPCQPRLPQRPRVNTHSSPCRHQVSGSCQRSRRSARRRQSSSWARRRSRQGVSAGGGISPNTPIKRSSNSSRLRSASSQARVWRAYLRAAKAPRHWTTSFAPVP